MWTEIDSADTQPLETDIPFGPVTTVTSMQGQVITQLDNLPTQHPHYSLIPNYINQAKDELLTLGASINRSVLDQLQRLRNWRWSDVTIAGQNWLPLPERMLWLEAMAYTKSIAAYDPSTTVLYPANPIPPGASANFGLYPRTSTGYPVLFHRAGSRLEMWPTPSSSPTDYRTTVVVYGTRMDKDLSAATDTLLMSPRLQLLVIDLSVAIAMEKMGWDEGSEKRIAVESKLSRLLSPGTEERATTRVRTRIAGTPQ